MGKVRELSCHNSWFLSPSLVMLFHVATWRVRNSFLGRCSALVVFLPEIPSQPFSLQRTSAQPQSLTSQDSRNDQSSQMTLPALMGPTSQWSDGEEGLWSKRKSMVHGAQRVPRVRNQTCRDPMGWHMENRVAVRHQGPGQWKTTKSRREPQVGTDERMDLRGGYSRPITRLCGWSPI